MRILIIRHGDPDYSIDSLTEKGWLEAELLSQRLAKEKIYAVFCSPLGRAKATMKPYLEKSGKTATICDWLEEFNYCKITDPLTGNDKDIWDFLPRFLQENPGFFVKEKWTDIDCIKNSDIEKTINYVFKSLDECIASFGYCRDGLFYSAQKPNHKTIAFFCHFGIEAILLSHLFNVSPQAVSQNFNACPSSVTELVTEEREKGMAFFRCQRFGDLSHLYAAGENPSFSGRFCECFTDDTRH